MLRGILGPKDGGEDCRHSYGIVLLWHPTVWEGWKQVAKAGRTLRRCKVAAKGLAAKGDARAILNTFGWICLA